MEKLVVSIVICTHRRPDLLKGAVKSLINQTVSPNKYEVIVVDNDFKLNNAVKNIVLNASKKIGITYVHEPKMGLSNARNTGGRLSTPDYIGYIDDDCRAPENYIDTILDLININKPDIFGGPYYPFYLDCKPKWFLDSYGTSKKGNSARYLSENEYLAGGNIIFRREILEKVKWFDPDLGMSGKRICYGEETMVIIKARQIEPNVRIYYSPELSVQHLVPKHKMSIINHFKISYNKGKSQVYFWIPRKNHKLARLCAPINTIRVILILILKTLPKVLFRDRAKYPYFQNYLFEEISKYFNGLGEQMRLTQDLFVMGKGKGDI